MKVWRMENEKGEGPYRARSTIESEWITDARWDIHDDGLGHPPPQRDGCGHGEPGWFSGFTSFEQVCNWFDGDELDRLEELGFELKQVEADEVREGKHQCLFRRAA